MTLPGQSFWHKLYNPYVLAIISIGYILGELGHYLIGMTSKAIATDLHYGDIACQLNGSFEHATISMPQTCSEANSSESCLALVDDNQTSFCEWTYNGLGIDYQILAGPSFIFVFTVVGVMLGYAADKMARVNMLAVCTLVFGIAIILCGTVKEYWQLVILRMLMAAGESGCNPLATGLLSDIFPENQRALVMSIFNWGIYGGYGIAFPVGRYVPPLNIWGLGWRLAYYAAGAIAVCMAVLTWLTLKEPQRQEIGQEATTDTNVSDAIHYTEEVPRKKDNKMSIWTVILDSRIIMLCLAASIRHCGGMCFAYNCDLYYQLYFPEYDLGWWLFAVTIIIGSIGVVVGGVVSDKFVAKMGVRSRVMILAISQLIATPGAFGSVYFTPVGAMITLGLSYFFAEMWFGILFAILVEIVPLHVRSTTVGVFLFVMNNIGGNLPILVEPLRQAIGFRESLYVFYAGAYGISSLMFLLTLFLMDEMPAATDKPTNSTIMTSQEHPKKFHNGLDNATFTYDDGTSIAAMVANTKRVISANEVSRL